MYEDDSAPGGHAGEQADGSTPAWFVYCAAPDEATAAAIADRVVGERLAACVNLVGPVQSVYRWEGRVEHAREWILVAKTTPGAFPRLRDRIRALHPYTCPAIVAMPIAAGWPGFLDWVRDACAAEPV